jgi:hypothetical protein
VDSDHLAAFDIISSRLVLYAHPRKIGDGHTTTTTRDGRADCCVVTSAI